MPKKKKTKKKSNTPFSAWEAAKKLFERKRKNEEAKRDARRK